MARYPIELGVRGEVRRNVRYLIELRVISSLLEGFRCIQLS